MERYGQTIVKSVDVDIFDEGTQLDPFPAYRAIRDSGPVCKLTHHGIYAVARHEHVKAVLSNWQDFSSASGVTMNSTMNQLTQGSVLASDPPEHSGSRKIITRPLAPARLVALKGRLSDLARERIARLIGNGPVDCMAELATLLPLTVVSELVGLPEEGRERMLEWAAAAFNGQAVVGQHPRSDAAFAVLGEMVEYLADPSLPKRLRPGSWAATLWEAVEAGELVAGDFVSVVQSYVTPSLDTTIFGLGNVLWLLANNPEQWAALKEQPSLAIRCVNEALRVESPVLGFARVTTRDVEIGGAALSAGSRLITLLGAANRDERRYENPDCFDIKRDASDHLAFGGGVHRCAGGNLAMLELTTVVEKLVKQVDRIDFIAAERSDSLGLRGFSKLELVLK